MGREPGERPGERRGAEDDEARRAPQAGNAGVARAS
jgi:hypothetical protein